MSTVTVTQSQALTYVWRPSFNTSAFTQHCLTAMAALSDILDSYEGESDELSASIWTWVREMRNVTDCTNDEELLFNAERNLNALIFTVLVDRFMKTPLQEPVLLTGTGWTCEKKFVDLSNLSIDGAPAVYTVHNFATEMLKWAHALIVQRDNLNPFFNDTGSLRYLSMTYNTVVTMEVASNRLDIVCRQAREKSAETQLVIARAVEQAEIRALAMVEINRQQLEILEQRIESIELTADQRNQETANAAQRRIEEVNNNLNHANRDIQHQAQTITGLRSEVDQVRASNANLSSTVQALQNQVAGMSNKRSCVIQ